MADLPAGMVPRLLTAQKVADYLDVSVPTVRRMVERGDLPRPIRLGGVVRWDRATIDRHLDDRASVGGRYDDPDEALARGEGYGREGRQAHAGRRNR